ncbi:MAG TPA: hypothetical protein VHM64_20450 [Candidatus Binatia bacterium]|nr:hypothetical protein [Candidatus Binatia bacterium]
MKKSGYCKTITINMGRTFLPWSASAFIFQKCRRPYKNTAAGITSVTLIFLIATFRQTEAQVLGQFSLTIAEEFNDNIFFSREREHDFITQVIPTFSLTYQPGGLTAPTFQLNLSPVGQIFARHPGENNFGENLSLDGQYRYAFSPRLNFGFTDALHLQGDARNNGLGANQFVPTVPTQPPPRPGLSREQRLGDFLSTGATIANHLSVSADYLASPNVTLNGVYTSGYTNFIDSGGSEVANTVGARGVYRWGQEHNLHAGYTIGFLKPRTGESSVVHTFDIGDDFLSSTQIQLTPTLTLAASSGISLNASGDGPRVANSTNLTLVKLWQTASLSAGLRKGLTNSFGVSGISDTLTVFTSFNIRLSERLSALASVDHSRFDTDDDDFNTLQAGFNVQYALTNWLCPSLRYSHRRRFGGESRATATTDPRFATGVNIYGNSVFLAITGRFDIWPNFRLGRGQGCGTGLPAVSPAAQIGTRL